MSLIDISWSMGHPVPELTLIMRRNCSHKMTMNSGSGVLGDTDRGGFWAEILDIS